MHIHTHTRTHARTHTHTHTDTHPHKHTHATTYIHTHTRYNENTSRTGGTPFDVQEAVYPLKVMSESETNQTAIKPVAAVNVCVVV
jgi:hypothetical protein